MKFRDYIKDNYKHLFILLCCIIIPKIFVALLQSPIQVSDEVGTLSAAAYLAGLDWSDVWGRISYYGTGYHAIFAILFKLTDNPYIIYRTILVSYVFVEAMAGVIVYHICQKYLIKDNKTFSCILAILIVYLQYNKDTWITNEAVIFLLIWIVALLMLELVNSIDNKKKKRLLTVVLCIVLAYAQTIHTRLIVLYPIVFALVVYIALCKKKSAVSIGVCGMVGITGFLIVGVYNDWIQNAVWLQHRVSDYLHNSSATDAAMKITRIVKLVEKEYLHAFLNTFIGQLDTANVMTLGIWMLALVVGVYVAYLALKKKGNDMWGLSNGILATYGGMGSLGLLGMQAIMWINNTKQTLDLGYGTTEFGIVNYSKAFVYLRYFAPFMGPVVLAMFSYLYKKRIKKMYYIGFGASILGQLYWWRYVMPYIYNNISTARVYIPFSLSSYTQLCNWNVYLPGSIILIISFIGIGILLKKKKVIVLSILLCCALVYQYMYYGINHKSEWTHRADAGYALIQELQKDFDLDGKLYVPYPAMAYTYQVMLNRYHIEMDDISVIDNILLFTNRASGYEYDEYITELGYTGFILDYNEYLYVKDKEMIKKIDSLGYSRYFVGDFAEELRKGTFNTLSNEGYVKLVYEVLLNRAADDVGLEAWTKELNEGLSRETFYMYIIESQEYKNMQQ